jgi:hypothetical protein
MYKHIICIICQSTKHSFSSFTSFSLGFPFKKAESCLVLLLSYSAGRPTEPLASEELSEDNTDSVKLEPWEENEARELYIRVCVCVCVVI